MSNQCATQRFAARMPAAWFAPLVVLLVVSGCATAPAPLAADAVLPPVKHWGYAFAQPDILRRQEAFGIARAITLLGNICAQSTAHGTAARSALAHWQTQQQDTLVQLETTLAQYHFAAPATAADVARLLRLPPQLSLDPESTDFDAVCVSYPAALQQPRYDLRARLQETDKTTTSGSDP